MKFKLVEYPSCNDWTKDNCLEYRRVVYNLYDKVKAND